MSSDSTKNLDTLEHHLAEKFDDGTFTSMLLDEGLKGFVESLAKDTTIFIVPSQDGTLMSDADSFSEKVKGLCFIAKGDVGEQFVSLSTDRLVELEETHLTFKPLLEGEHEQEDRAGSEKAEIERSFTIDTDELECRVFLINSQGLPSCKPPLRHPSPATLADNHTPSVDSIMSPAQDSNPWRDLFLNKLRTPLAEPIVKDIKIVLRKLLDENRTTVDKSDVAQEFYKTFQESLLSHPSWKDATREELDGSLDAVEKYIFGKCYTSTFQPSDEDDAIQDRLFVEKCRMLSESGFSFSQLVSVGGGQEGESKGKADNTKEPDFGTFEEAIDSLLQLDQVQSPNCKLDALMGVVKNVAKVQANGSADLLIPTLVWIIVKTCLPTLISDVRYIQRFRDHCRLTGEAAFCLTNVIAVITTIEKMHAEQISRTDPIYSMIASQELNTATNDPSDIASPLSHIASKPMAEFNSVASSVINTIGFVPRAIGSAVVDTFRSRSNRASKEGSVGVSPLPKPSISATSSPKVVGMDAVVDPKVNELRQRISKAEEVEKVPLSMTELRLMLQDYRALLKGRGGLADIHN